MGAAAAGFGALVTPRDGACPATHREVELLQDSLLIACPECGRKVRALLVPGERFVLVGKHAAPKATAAVQ